MTSSASLPFLEDPDGYAFIQRGRGWAGNGVKARMEPDGTSRFLDTQAWAKEQVRDGDVVFASFSFDPTEPSSVAIPEQTLIVDETRSVFRPTHSVPRSRVRHAGSSISSAAWTDAVATAVNRINNGQYHKIVLARDEQLWSEHPLNPIDLASSLATTFPSSMTFLHERFVGASPELLLHHSGKTVQSIVLAGTAPPDSISGEALLHSAKDREEHRFAADSVVESLSPFMENITVSERPWLLHLDNVQHLATTVEGTLHHPAHILDLVDVLHPTAAVGGVPRTAAVADISGLERMNRGRYAGPVGVFNAAGEGTFAVALRCAEVEGNTARLFAGAGIVSTSVPSDELAETTLKFQAMRTVLPTVS